MRDDWPARGEARRVAERTRAVLARANASDLDDDLDDNLDDDLNGNDLNGDDLDADGLDDAFDEFDDEVGDPAPRRGSRDAPARRQRWRERWPVRLDPGRRAALGISLAVVLAAIVTGIWLSASRPAPVPVSARAPSVPGGPLVDSAGHTAGVSSRSSGPPLGDAASGSPAATGAASTTAGVVVVDVAGKVARPGLYRLPAGSRVDDAIKAAGGPRRGVDLSSLNLAAPLSDGQQIAVGAPGAAAAGGTVGGVTGGTAGGSVSPGGATVPGGKIDINTASLGELDGLPGVGPVLAQHILDWRSEHGQFASVDQLNDVSGIGDVKFAELRDLVTV